MEFVLMDDDSRPVPPVGRVRIYMELQDPMGKSVFVSHDYDRDNTVGELLDGNLQPLQFMGERQWGYLLDGLRNLKR